MAFWFFLLLAIASLSKVHAQLPTTDGFVSIDCGISSNTNYTDENTNIPYVSDDGFIDTGTDHTIASNYADSSLEKQLQTLRSFPNGSRNCYALTVTPEQKYLVRASFMYGSYDGLNGASPSNPLLFDLHLGVNFWTTVNITKASDVHRAEVIFVAAADSASVCLAKTGSATPFISALELRPLKNTIYSYANSTQNMVLFLRINLAPTTNNLLRFEGNQNLCASGNSCETKTDTESKKKKIATPIIVIICLVPVMLFLVAIFIFCRMRKSKGSANISVQHLIRIHHRNLVSMVGYCMEGDHLALVYEYMSQGTLLDYIRGKTRNVSVFSWGKRLQIAIEAAQGLEYLHKGCKPPLIHRDVKTANILLSEQLEAKIADFGLSKAIQNDVTNVSTAVVGTPGYLDPELANGNIEDVVDSKLQGEYDLNSVWKVADIAFRCTSQAFHERPTMTDVVAELKESLALECPRDTTSNRYVSIDCGISSNTNYTDETTNIPYVSDDGFIDTGADHTIASNYADSSLEKQLQTLRSFPNGSRNCYALTVTSKQKYLVSLLHVQELRRPEPSEPQQSSSSIFTLASTFGRPSTSPRHPITEGIQNFVLVEIHVHHLIRIHHKNLVSMVGYCMDGDHLALVYEYMSQGTLLDYIRGKTRNVSVFSWGKRLQIAIEAAQGLEYLHNGCKPPLIHRDVKTANILLGEQLEAKIADFGLSKAIQNDVTNVPTAVVGTPDTLIRDVIDSKLRSMT
ncbi:receptor-like serine threonine-protein kinase [Musa troglodytarum]|uniref:Receptor-like serine threonine-protein kinase n=1 Tax=Musa troglodytarum TaxID=320322 RepID=A0A9E7GTB9_9LILI|nr:receptor-like serine threonine-protein kinase [Musa troglodytarum]